MRILIPFVHLGPDHFKDSDDDEIDDETSTVYVNYVIKHIFKPAGITGVNVVPTGSTPYTRYYNFNNTAKSFAYDPSDDARLRCGAGYWYLSTREYARFIQGLRLSKIFSAKRWKTMWDGNLGCYTMGASQNYRTHNGGLTLGDGSGCQGAWVAFPGGVTAVVLINSQGGFVDGNGNALYAENLLQQSYEAAL